MHVRPLCLPDDEGPLRALDTSFTTDAFFEVVQVDDGFLLVELSLDGPVTKRFPLDDLDEAGAWDTTRVAVEGEALAAFLAAKWQRWNRRLVIQHLYVDAPYRRRGIGRSLVEAALSDGVAAGMRTAWVETSSWNVPGIRAWRAMGFALSGLDVTLYRGTSAEGEDALFLARDLGATLP